jgi:hypothetical protein
LSRSSILRLRDARFPVADFDLVDAFVDIMVLTSQTGLLKTMYG